MTKGPGARVLLGDLPPVTPGGHRGRTGVLDLSGLRLDLSGVLMDSKLGKSMRTSRGEQRTWDAKPLVDRASWRQSHDQSGGPEGEGAVHALFWMRRKSRLCPGNRQLRLPEAGIKELGCVEMELELGGPHLQARGRGAPGDGPDCRAKGAGRREDPENEGQLQPGAGAQEAVSPEVWSPWPRHHRLWGAA